MESRWRKSILKKILLTRMLHHMETFMVNALRDEAVVDLPRVSNNAGLQIPTNRRGHGSLSLARRVKSFQVVIQLFALKTASYFKSPVLPLTVRYCIVKAFG